MLKSLRNYSKTLENQFLLSNIMFFNFIPYFILFFIKNLIIICYVDHTCFPQDQLFTLL